METPQQEKIFFQDTDVTVTQSRFISGGTTYAMRNISSVFLYKFPKNLSKPKFLIAVGIILLIISNDIYKLIGVAVIVLGILWFKSIKDKYAVRISTNAGQLNSIISEDSMYLQKIVDAVNDAMVHRG